MESGELSAMKKYIGEIHDNLPRSIVSPQGKLQNAKGAIKTKDVLTQLDAFADQLTQSGQKLDPITARQLDIVQEYLSWFLSVRGTDLGSPISTKHNLRGLRAQSVKITNIFKRLKSHTSKEDAVLEKSCVITINPAKITLTVTEPQGGTTTFTRDAQGNFTTTKKETDFDFSNVKGPKLQIQQRLKQVESDWSRLIQVRKAPLKFEGVDEADTIDLKRFIQKTMSPDDQKKLLYKLFDQLPISLTTGIDREQQGLSILADVYGVSKGETEADQMAAILANRIKLFCSSTTMVTVHQNFGKAITPKAPLEFFPVLRIIEGEDGAKFPMLSVDTEFETGVFGTESATGIIKATIDPITGITDSSCKLKIRPK